MPPRIIVERKRRPGFYAQAMKALRRRDMVVLRDLAVAADKRRNYQLEIANLNSLLQHKLYGPGGEPNLLARKQALEAAVRDTLGP